MRADQRQAQQVGRLERGPVAAEEAGTAHRSEVDRQQQVLRQVGPGAPPGPDRDIDIVGGEIGQRVAGQQPYRHVGMRHLEAAEPPREPGVGEGIGRGDGQQPLVLGTDRGEGRIERIESAADLRRDTARCLGQHDALLLAAEQRHAEPLLQQFHLIADRCLSHAEFRRGGREILVARGGLEHANGGEGRDAAHTLQIRQPYGSCPTICWRQLSARAHTPPCVQRQSKEENGDA